MGQTSTQAKNKYNEREYARYTIRIRKDDDLYEKVEEFMARNKYTSLNAIVNKRLKEFFEIDRIYRTDDEICTTCRRPL
ncbi:MAG: hypothetical protein FWG30_03190 [Eubacteriaceae bacterium]|nr:hypothetical protein [Eubacteriaceae bacterium]